MRQLWIVVSCLMIAVCSLLGIMFGSAALSWQAVWAGLTAGPFNHDIHARIIWMMRMPRVVLALLTGATLASAGALLQTATRNPLADPFLFGLSSGAAAGAVTMIVCVGDVFGVWTAAFGAGLGALLSTAGFLLLLWGNGLRTARDQITRIVLSGLAMSFIFSTLTNLMIFRGDRNTAQSVLFWTMGSFASARWASLPFVAVGMVLVCAYGWRMRRSLDALSAGEDTARSLGVDVGRLRVTVLFVSALGCAMTVALCGPIAFVGLIAPHIARHLFGTPLSRHFALTPVLGALLTVGADLVSRHLVVSQELPIGIVMSGIGGVFLIILVGRAAGQKK